MVIFPHTHSKYRSLESRIDWQNDRTNTEQLDRRVPHLHHCMSHRKLLFFFFHLSASWSCFPSSLAFFIRTRVCRDREGRLRYDRFFFFQISSPRQFFGGRPLTIGPGSSLSGWQLYKKKEPKKLTGTHVKMEETNNPTKKNADVFRKSSMSSNT